MGKGMIPEELYAPIMEFVSRANEIPNLVCAILFGSVVTGEMSKKSDIDILLVFDTEHNPEVGEESKTAVKIAGQIAKKHRLDYPFSFVAVSLREKGATDVHFLWQVSREGIVIWGRPERYLFDEEFLQVAPRLIVSYSMTGLRPREKKAVERALFGYEVRKRVNDKFYLSRKEGIIDGKQGVKIGQGSLLVSDGALEKVVELFEKYGVRYSEIKVWR